MRPIEFIQQMTCGVNKRSYISGNLLNELSKRDKMRVLPSILSLFRNKLMNKFNNTRAQMIDSI